MFILQDINNYETTGSDKFCKFDREINQNITPSCFIITMKIMAQKMQLIESKKCFVPFRNEVSEFLMFKFNRPLIRKAFES